MCTVLQFSGGKDSLACLYLLKPQWLTLHVVWANTGAAFPETLEQMQRMRELIPHFHELQTQQNIEAEGYPVDVLPIAHTRIGQRYEGTAGRLFQSRYTCCGSALWLPMQQFMKTLGAKIIVRGEKRCDQKGSGLTNGAVVDGIEYRFPLADWSDTDVYAYLKEQGVALPPNYGSMSTGLDCWNCTAYLDETGKLGYLREHHPEKHVVVASVLRDYRHALQRELVRLA